MRDSDLLDVASLPVPGALVRLVQMGFTGTLHLGPALRVVFREGRILDVLSDREEDDLAGVMRASGKIDAATLARFTRERNPSAPVVDELVRMGIVPVSDAPKALAWRAMSLLQGAMLRPPGPLSLRPDEVPSDAQPRGVDLRRIVARIWKQMQVGEGRVAELEERLERYCIPLPGAAEIVATLDLSDKEKDVWDVILERPLSLRDVVRRSVAFRGRVLDLVYRLVSLSLLRLDPNPPVDAGMGLDELVRWKEALERGSPYDVLSVHPSTFPDEVSERARKLLGELDAFDRRGSDEVRAAVNEIRTLVKGAAARLSDPTGRLEVRRQWYADEQLRQFATIQFQKAEAALFWRQDFVEALALLRSAVDLAPSEAQFQALLAYVAAATRGAGGTRTEALQALDRILRTGPTNVEARSFAIASAAAGLLQDGGRQTRLAEMARRAPGFDAAAKSYLQGEGLPRR